MAAEEEGETTAVQGEGAEVVEGRGEQAPRGKGNQLREDKSIML